MHFIFLILLVALFIFLFVLMSVFGFIRSIFGFGRKRNQSQENIRTFDQEANQKEKIFKKTEGEYVDYEEVKDE